MKSKKSGITIICIMIYAYIGGITSLSKGIPSILLMPVMAEALLHKKKGSLIFPALWYCILYHVVPNSRGLIYSDINAYYTFYQMLIYSAETLRGVNLIDIVFSCVDRLSDRLYGGQTLVLTSQYDKMTFGDLVSYYGGNLLSNIIPDMAGELFRMRLETGMAIGVGIGLLGTVNVLAHGSVSLLLLQGFIVSLMLVLLDKALDNLMESENGNGVKLLSLIVVFGVVVGFYLQMLPLLFLYLLVAAFYIGGRHLKKFRYVFYG